MIEKKSKIEMPEPIETKEESGYSVKITSDSLNVRKTPTDRNSDNIVYQITDHSIHEITKEENGFGMIEDGNWIMLAFSQKVK